MPEPVFFALPDHTLVGLQGMDAAAFAQAQFANDVAGLAPGQWQWNAWLTSKGRVIALFALLRRADDDFLLLVPDYPADALASQLARYVFRRKLKVAARPDLHVSGRFAVPVTARGALAGIQDGAAELDFGADGGARTLCIDARRAAEDPQAWARWFAFDLAHGLPRLPEAQREQWTPQQLSLERLPAFSVKKGCYPGQEIVARTHFIGKAKRNLQCFATDGDVVDGMPVREGHRDIGSIVCAVRDGGQRRLLAVLPLEHPGEGLSADGHALEQQPLLGGLRR